MVAPKRQLPHGSRWGIGGCVGKGHREDAVLAIDCVEPTGGKQRVLQRGDAYHSHNTQVPEQTNKQARTNNKQQTCAVGIKYFVVRRDEIRTLSTRTRTR